MSIKDQCKAVLADGKGRTVTELARDVVAKYPERNEKTVATTIYTICLNDPAFNVSDGRPKQLTLSAAA